MRLAVHGHAVVGSVAGHEVFDAQVAVAVLIPGFYTDPLDPR